MSKREKQRGSLTLEMSVILPIFIFLFLAVFGMFSQVLCQNELTHALVQTTKSLSMDPYLNERTDSFREGGKEFWENLGLANLAVDIIRLDNNIYYSAADNWYENSKVPEEVVRNRLIGFLGGGDDGAKERASKKLEELGVVNGIDGIEITATVADQNINVKISYTRKFLFDFWGMGTTKASHEATSRLWIGDSESGKTDVAAGGGAMGGRLSGTGEGELLHLDEQTRLAIGAQYMTAADILRISNAKEAALSTDDGIAKYLQYLRETNEKSFMQAESYLYYTTTFKWGDGAKKMYPGSETVDEARKKAIQNAYATMISAAEPTYSQWGIIDEEIMGVLGVTGAGVGLYGDVLEESVKILDGAGAKVLDEAGNLIDAGKVASEASKDYSAVGTAISVVSLALETAVDMNEYAQWSKEQRRVFVAALDSSAQNLQLLNEIKTAFPDDKILVDYCDDMIRDIDDFTKGNDIIRMVRDVGENVGATISIAGKNVLDGTVDYVVPKAVASYINYAVGGGAIVTGIGQVGGAIADYAYGTSSTIESLEDVDIMYTNVEDSIYAYHKAEANGTLTPSAQRFQELNILNQKMAAVEMSTSINMEFGKKNQALVDDIESMKTILQNSYEKLASDIS